MNRYNVLDREVQMGEELVFVCSDWMMYDRTKNTFYMHETDKQHVSCFLNRSQINLQTLVSPMVELDIAAGFLLEPISLQTYLH